MKKWPFLLAFLLVFSAFNAQAADFSLPSVSGKTFKLSSYRGKWVVVNYWATWCPPCKAEIPELVDFHNRHSNNNAVVLGVNYEDKSAAELQAFVKDYEISYPVLLGGPGVGQNVGPVPGLPTTYVVSPEGQVVARQVGPLTAEMLDNFIAKQTKP